jgi:hypothetical protein
LKILLINVYIYIYRSFSYLKTYIKNVIVLGVLHECETWSLAIREEQILRVSEKHVLRRIFVLKTVGIEGWKQLHNEEFLDLTVHKFGSGQHIYEDAICWTCDIYERDEK